MSRVISLVKPSKHHFEQHLLVGLLCHLNMLHIGWRILVSIELSLPCPHDVLQPSIPGSSMAKYLPLASPANTSEVLFRPHGAVHMQDQNSCRPCRPHELFKEQHFLAKHIRNSPRNKGSSMTPVKTCSKGRYAYLYSGDRFEPSVSCFPY